MNTLSQNSHKRNPRGFVDEDTQADARQSRLSRRAALRDEPVPLHRSVRFWADEDGGTSNV